MPKINDIQILSLHERYIVYNITSYNIFYLANFTSGLYSYLTFKLVIIVFIIVCRTENRDFIF